MHDLHVGIQEKEEARWVDFEKRLCDERDRRSEAERELHSLQEEMVGLNREVLLHKEQAAQSLSLQEDTMRKQQLRLEQVQLLHFCNEDSSDTIVN